MKILENIKIKKGKMYHVMAYVMKGIKHIKHKLWRNVVKETGVIYVVLVYRYSSFCK
jgi:hypothetical protein